MDRTDTLDDPPSLDPRQGRPRHGHAPALWLALPLFLGCWTRAELGLGPWCGWALGLLGLALAAFGGPRLSRAGLAAAGIGLGAAWHGALAAETGPWDGKPGPAHLFLRIGRAEADGRGGWWALGTVEGGSRDALRRRVLAEGQGGPPARGALVVMRGMARADDGSSGWRRSQGVSLRLGRAELRETLEPAGPWRAACSAAGARLREGLSELAWESPRGARLLAATMLGDSRLLGEEERAAFAATGTLHLFAISGLHIAGMAAILVAAASAARLPPRASAAGALALLALYVEVTGGTPSARRAWLMAAGLLACRWVERRPNPIQGLSLAAALTLLADPEAATDAGFQLSYLSVGGILLAGGPAAREATRPGKADRLARPAGPPSRPRRWLGALRARAAEGACVATAAGAAGAPLSASLFGQVAPGGVAANVLLVPMAGPPLALGMLSAALATWDGLGPVRRVANALAASWLEAMARLAELMAAAPGMGVAREWAHPWVGAACQAGMVALLLANAEARGWRALLLPPLAWAAGWLALLAG